MRLIKKITSHISNLRKKYTIQKNNRYQLNNFSYDDDNMFFHISKIWSSRLRNSSITTQVIDHEVGKYQFTEESEKTINLLMFIYQRRLIKRRRSLYLNNITIEYENGEAISFDYNKCLSIILRSKNINEVQSFKTDLL